MSNAATISAARLRSANDWSAALIVATFVLVPRISRAASSHSSFTSTVMRVMRKTVHQDRGPRRTKITHGAMHRT